MGAKNSKIDETVIRNEIDTTVKNSTENITNILNQSITNTTSNLINTNATNIQSITAGTNTARFGNLNLSGNSLINVNQEISIDAVNKAIAQLMSNADAIKQLGQNINNGLENTVNNDSSLQASMQAIAAIKDAETSAGGPEELVRTIMKAVTDLGDSLTGTSSNEEKRTMIMNKIGMNIENYTLNKNEIKNIIEKNVNTNIQNVNSANCQLNTTSSNELQVGDANLTGNAQFILAQSQNLKTLNSCLMTNLNTTSLREDLTSNNTIQTTNTSANKSDSKTDQKTNSSTEKIKENKSAIMDFLKSAVGIWAIVIVVIIVAIVIFLMFSIKNSKNVVELAKAAKDLKNPI